ncbi:hypothetical protein GCM10009557_68820 [Virgisporangium ochraceum]|uniref:Uncharacterized protein n=1 Tax=Virgisporangium ochraceum TaxID=65505 RepID=A0A8J4ECK5_9ACTN|nr:hypothetical protein [Virgisporangium ochraceum]GIJ66987.1 hypothetical protein Voc01_019040 [Virgisporangium ochraceum]
MLVFRGLLVLTLAFAGLGAAVPAGAEGPVPLGRTSLRAADPSVIRVGGTYISAQSAGGGIHVRQASSPDGLASAASRQVWSDTATWVRSGHRRSCRTAAGTTSTSPPDAVPPTACT